MRTHTTQPWADATISLYAATDDGTPAYQVDNVSLSFTPAASNAGTDCTDPTAPASAGSPGPNLLVNGDFSAGMQGWIMFGQIVGQVSGGVFESYRPAGSPAGVVLQPSGQAMTNDTALTASFRLGNSSSIRRRVTVLLHDLDFSDLSACTFWLPPGCRCRATPCARSRPAMDECDHIVLRCNRQHGTLGPARRCRAPADSGRRDDWHRLHRTRPQHLRRLRGGCAADPARRFGIRDSSHNGCDADDE
jgi:hypothetical protein